MATVRDGWTMPPAPAEGAVPAFYNDGTEIWLHWVHDDGGEYLPVEGVGDQIDIAWPFVEEHATHDEIEALGFRNLDT